MSLTRHLIGGFRKLWIRKAVGCCKLGSIGHLSRSMEGRSVESNVDYKGTAQKVSEGKNVRGHSCDISAKNKAPFCLCS